MGLPVTENKMTDGGDTWIIGAGGSLTIEDGATVTGLTGQTTFASDAEAVTGTLTDKVISPKALKAAATTHVAAASATVAGKVELATNLETVAVTDQVRAVTPYGLGAAILSIDVISFVGKNLTGACTMTGVKVNDIVMSVTGTVAADVGAKGALFETTITVADQIQQVSATDLSNKVYTALIYRLS